MDLARELKQLGNMKVKVISIVAGDFGTVSKELARVMEQFEIRERIATIQTTILFRSARILRRVMETRGDLLSLRLW